MAGEKATCECGSAVPVSEESNEGDGADEPAGSAPEGQLPRDGWYVDMDGESVGPRTLEELREEIRNGDMSFSQKVYHRTMDDWKSVSSLPGLASSSMPPPEGASVGTEEEERQWYVRVGGSKYGPYNDKRVQRMLDKNQLRPDSQIWNSEVGQWESVREVEPFASTLSEATSSSSGANASDNEPVSSQENSSSGEKVQKKEETTREEETTHNETTDRAKRRNKEASSRTGLTTNLKGLFQRGEKGKAESNGAQVPSTVLTVEYVDDTEGIETYLKDIVRALESLQDQTDQVQQYVSRLARAMNQQKQRNEKAMKALRRRLDRLYTQLENQPGPAAPAEESEEPPPPPEDMEEPEEYGVPEEYTNDDAHHRAWQVAEVMASDLEVYHEEELEEGVMYGNLEEILEEPIAEARETYSDRTPERVREEVDYFDMALNKLVARKKREMDQEEVS